MTFSAHGVGSRACSFLFRRHGRRHLLEDDPGGRCRCVTHLHGIVVCFRSNLLLSRLFVCPVREGRVPWDRGGLIPHLYAVTINTYISPLNYTLWRPWYQSKSCLHLVSVT